MPGPPPKDPSVRARKNATLPMVDLPASGYQRRAPNWPLIENATIRLRATALKLNEEDLREEMVNGELTGARRDQVKQKIAKTREERLHMEALLEASREHEVKLWKQLWKTPMAIMWHKLGWERDVALYVRLQIQAEMGDIEAAREARARGETLGMTHASLLRLRWRIIDDENPDPQSPMSVMPRRRRRQEVADRPGASPLPTVDMPADDSSDDGE